VIKLFQNKLLFKNKEIPRIILGTAPFTGEGYFGHRSRLYQLDLYDIPENIAKIIKKSNQLGINCINLTTDNVLIESLDMAISEGVNMEVIGIIGKTNVNYMFPNFNEAKKANWKKDIETLSKYNTPVILVDEFIVDSYDWDLLEEILNEIKKQGFLPGLTTSFPFKTSKKLLKSPIMDLFDFYMVPINKLGYMMDTDSFLDKERKELSKLLKSMNKKIIVNKILAAGIQRPEEAFEFLKTLDYVDMISIGIASNKEAEEDFNLLKKI
jgi:hypothetical protein